jgi:NTP pyrophosphatase (non-canonical NTP hydrolase)
VIDVSEFASDFDDYQMWTRTTAIYPTINSGTKYAYLALGLNGEAGEVAEKVKKAIRDGGGFDATAVALELGDVLWYLTRLADELGIGLAFIAALNQSKLTSRQERGTLKGSGDDR